MIKHPLPIEALDSDIAILGRKGGGKTITAKGIAERLLHLKRRVLILDPLGGWWGLRSAANGVDAGLPIAVFGGEHADVALDPAAAVPLADVIGRENFPAVIDIADMSKTTQQRFLLAFLRELKRINRDPLTVILEEADVFAPQKPVGDDSQELHNEIDWLARRGRARGFRLITVCQRPARLSKDVLTQASTVIAHVLPSPQDREAVKAWVEGNADRDATRDVFATLAKLKTGEAWTLYAGEGDSFLRRVVFPMIETFDSTKTPKAGERRLEPKRLADVDTKPILEALAKAKAEPAAKTKAPAAIEQDRQREAGRIAVALKAEFERGFAAGSKSGAQEVAAPALERLRKLHGSIKPALEQLESWIDSLVLPAAAGPPVDALKAAAGEHPAARFSNGSKPARIKPSTGARAVVESLAYWRALGFDDVSMTHAAVVAGYSPKASTFRGYSSAAHKAGLIRYPRAGRVALTDAGKAMIGPGIGKATGAELRAKARAILKPAPAAIFDLLVSHYPRALDHIFIANALGLSPNASTVRGYMSAVTSLGMAEIVGIGERRAPDWLFPELRGA